MMNGWIKINRAITEHWLWQDAERLKWWFDLLFLAAWEDKKVMHDTHVFTLRRGQIIASISFLSERWKRNHQTIIRYIKMLESEDMITRKVLYRQTPILTICNYDKYQVQGAPQVDTIVDTIADTIVDTIVDTNKRNKEYISTTSSNAHARESKDLKFVEELKSSQFWLEQMAMNFYISTDEIKSRLDKFYLDCKCRGTEHQNFNDTRRHFNDWLRIQLDAERKKEQGYGRNRQEQTDKRRSTEITATKAKDYEGAF